MCILFLAIDTHPDYPLILCANRDEFHHRPTAPAHFWPPSEQILAGKDLQAGGSWLGINRQGQIAALTNLRNATQSNDMKSRGELVIKALESNHGANFLNWLQNHAHNYNPFNLVFTHNDGYYCFNSASQALVHLTQGFHSVSNGAMDDIWPKMAKGEQALEALITQQKTLCIDELIELMKDETQASDELLPETGIALEWERRLSSIYIHHNEYGTRSTSIITLNKLGQYHFTEVRYDGKGRQLGRQDFSL